MKFSDLFYKNKQEAFGERRIANKKAWLATGFTLGLAIGTGLGIALLATGVGAGFGAGILGAVYFAATTATGAALLGTVGAYLGVVKSRQKEAGMPLVYNSNNNSSAIATSHLGSSVPPSRQSSFHIDNSQSIARTGASAQSGWTKFCGFFSRKETQSQAAPDHSIEKKSKEPLYSGL